MILAMRMLVLGHGKTGKLVAEVASERGHGVHVLDAKENADSAALTPPFLSGFDVVIDFTTPDAVIRNLKACLATGAKVVVGTTGWYGRLNEMRGLAERKQGALLYGTNFSVGVQVMFQLAEQMGKALAGKGYQFKIEETHHISKLDSPSGTAISIQQIVAAANPANGKPEIKALREGDASGLHALEARSAVDSLVLTHEAFSRRGFAEGAVSAAQWLADKTGCYDFRDVFSKL